MVAPELPDLEENADVQARETLRCLTEDADWLVGIKVRVMAPGGTGAANAVPSLGKSEKFERTLREVRQRGIARAIGDPIPGINGLSAPVFDSNGNVVLAITAIGAAGVFDARWSSPLIAEVKRCADAISAELGWQHRDARATRQG